MFKYILKRFVLFVPTLIIISLLAFVISVNAPGDPVERLSKAANKEGSSSEQSNASKQVKQKIRHELGLDLPVFYLSLATLADSDTLYKIEDKSHKENLNHLTRKYGNWDDISNYYHELRTALNTVSKLNTDSIFKANSTIEIVPIVDATSNKDSISHDTLYHSKYDKNTINETKNNILFSLVSLQETANENVIDSKISQTIATINSNSFISHLSPAINKVFTSFGSVKDGANKWKTYVPALQFYGRKNQYHRWLFGEASWFSSTPEREGYVSKGVLRGDFGKSYIDNQLVSSKIWKKFTVSFVFIFLSVVLSYLVSIPIGIYSAYRKDSTFDRASSVVLFILYSMPSFFVGTLLLYMFANPDVYVWFPESGFEDPATYDANWPFFKRIAHHWPYMVLPLVTYTYGSFAFLSRIMRVGMVGILKRDFIRTARAKGLTEKTVILKHALRNSLLPIITVFANIFPVAIGGSVIIEVIFSLPGMGLETFNAILNYDYPMIVSIFTISGFLTIIGYLVADILYAIVDPRISYS